MRPALARAVLLTASIVFSLLLAELLLRLTPYGVPTSDVTSQGRISANYWIQDAELGVDIRKNVRGGVHRSPEFDYPIFSNEYGCFDHQRELPDDYGLIVGDSFTWGYSPLDKMWTSYLEDRSGIFMLKCGVASYGTKQELLKAKRVVSQAPKNPKYLILMYYHNDMNNDFFFSQRHRGHVQEIDLHSGTIVFSPQPQLSEGAGAARRQESGAGAASDDANEESFFRRLRKRAALYNFYDVSVKPQLARLKSWLFGEEPRMPRTMKGTSEVKFVNYLNQMEQLPWFEEMVDEHRQTLTDVVEFSEEIGAKLLFVDVLGSLDNPVFRGVFDRSHAYYYNLATDYPDQSRWFYDGHTDITGNQETGEHIYQHFRELGIFD